MRTIALLALCAALALAVAMAVAAPAALVPQASAAQGEYCPPGELRRRFVQLKRFTKQMSQQRYRYFRTTRSARARAAFVRKQEAQRRALLRALLRCD
jgi:hypothetical protein